MSMKTYRRDFLQKVGTGVAGVGPAASSPPLASELKSKRIKFDVPQNQISWAF